MKAPRLDQTQSKAWKARAAARVPVMAQTFSKAPMSLPQGSYPAFLRSGKGCRVTDVDGNEYLDFILGLGPVILGYGNPVVDQAVRAQLESGISFSLGTPLEVELAELLAEVIPCAERTRFFKTGSDATSAAVRSARAFTGRDTIAYASYHGWHDWYAATTTRGAGIPSVMRELVAPFAFNDLASLHGVLTRHAGRVAAVILEPLTLEEPGPGYLEELCAAARKAGAVVIFDEIVTGFRCHVGGAQAKYGVTPDLATFGKAMGNGLPIAALCGRAELMRTFEDTFISGTFGGETLSLAGARACIEELRKKDVPTHLEAMGERVKAAFSRGCKRHRVDGEAIGHGSHFLMTPRDRQGVASLEVKALYSQECVRRGVLFHVGANNICYAHGPEEIARTEQVIDEALEVVGAALAEDAVRRYLDGEPHSEVFPRNR